MTRRHRAITLPNPVLGLDSVTHLRERDIRTSYDMRNFRIQQPNTDRLRASQRAGLVSAYGGVSFSAMNPLSETGTILASSPQIKSSVTGAIYVFDRNVSNILKIDTDGKMTMIAVSGNSNDGWTRPYEHNGNIHAWGEGRYSVKVDPTDDSATLLSSTATSNRCYAEFAYDGNRIAFDSEGTAKFNWDLSTDAITKTTISTIGDGRPWVVEDNGFAYFCPWGRESPSQGWIKFDLSDDSFSEVGGGNYATGTDGVCHGLFKVGAKLFAGPGASLTSHGDAIVSVYDLSADSVTDVQITGTTGTGLLFSGSSYCSANGKIYAPCRLARLSSNGNAFILIFDTADNSYVLKDIGAATSALEYWSDPILLGESVVIPSVSADPIAGRILTVDTSDDTVSITAASSILPGGNGNFTYGGFHGYDDDESGGRLEAVLMPQATEDGDIPVKVTASKGGIVQNINHLVTTIATGDSFDVAGVGKWHGAVKAPNGAIYAAPWYDNSFLKISSDGKTLKRLGDYSGTLNDGTYVYRRWNAGVVGGDGKVYFVPRHSPFAVVLDPSDDSLAQVGGSTAYGAGANKWIGCALASNGFIYAAPANNANVIKVNTSDGSFASIHVSSKVSKWYGLVEADNGKLYGIVYGEHLVGSSAEENILKIDPATDSVSQFGTIGVGESGKYAGGVLAGNGKIYGIPSNADTVLKIDPDTDTATEFGSVGSGSGKWINGVLGTDGKVYGIPYNSDKVLVIDPSDDSISYMTSTLLSADSKQFNSAAVADDGRIYCIPYDYSGVLRITPANVDDGWHPPGSITVLR